MCGEERTIAPRSFSRTIVSSSAIIGDRPTVVTSLSSRCIINLLRTAPDRLGLVRDVSILALYSQSPITHPMGLIELLILLGLGAGTAGLIAKSNRRKRLESAFYQLLRQQDSCISLIQLMAISQVNSQTTKIFLDEQVRLLNGIPEVDDDGDTFYRFPKLKLPDAIVNDDW
jgi:hypothetical protein